MTEPTKPLVHIEELYSAFQHFQAQTQRVIREQNPGNWERGITQAREGFRSKLATWGLAQYIDWEQH